MSITGPPLGVCQSHRKSGKGGSTSSSIWLPIFVMKGKELDPSAMLADNEEATRYRLPNVSAVRTGLAPDTT
eukprot:4179663-Amphidinium_carterae.1